MLSHAGPRSESLLLGNRELPSRPDRHNVFIEWNNKYGSVLRRRFADTHVSASLHELASGPLTEHPLFARFYSEHGSLQCPQCLIGQAYLKG